MNLLLRPVSSAIGNLVDETFCDFKFAMGYAKLLHVLDQSSEDTLPNLLQAYYYIVM